MSYVTDAKLLQAVAGRLKTTPSGLPAYYADEIVPQANVAATQDILGRLLARGYTQEQIDVWDRRVEFAFALGVYYSLLNSGAYAGLDPKTMELLDRRKELDTILVFAGGVITQPVGNRPGLTATAGPSAQGGIFNYPDPDDTTLGNYIDW
jgi:hypothetical protein